MTDYIFLKRVESRNYLPERLPPFTIFTLPFQRFASNYSMYSFLSIIIITHFIDGSEILNAHYNRIISTKLLFS